jgi:branched-chain amino acid transport system permease protein
MDFVAILQNATRSAIGPDAVAFALAAIGLNVHFGYTGLRNFGQVGFMLVGAYGTAVAVDTWGWSLWVGIPFALLMAVVFALLLGGPTLRLRGDYFAIVTIAAAEVLRFVVRSTSATDITGGPYGLTGNLAQEFYDLSPFDAGERYGWEQLSFLGNQLWTLLVGWAVVIIVTVLVALMVRAPFGRVLRAIREDEDVARSLGKHVVSFKMQALIVGGVIGALGGIIQFLSTSGVGANTYQPQVTFFAYTVLILGGTATRIGPIVGAFLFQFLFAGSQSLLSQLGREDLLPSFLEAESAQGALSLALVGLGLILLLIFRPQGIFGSKEEMVLE